MDRHNSTVHPYAVWPYARDHAQPTTPYAAEQLAKCRTYEPPSKAHIKRLLKIRPRVTVAAPKIQRDDTVRHQTNEAMHYARQTLSFLRRTVGA